MIGRRWTPAFSWLDVKLGMRMMRKYPGVSLAIVFALAVGIPVSLVPNHLVNAAMGVSPPFDDGDRVIGVTGVGQEVRTELRVGDYERLRARLTTLSSLGAAIRLEVNVVSGDGWSEGERAALMTSSLFTLTRVPPMMGRGLLAADEIPGAPAIAVVGHGFWQRRLGAAQNVVGTTLRIAGVPTTIVGVMPDGFAMPSTEQLWLPLRFRSVDYANGLGPAVWMYGRLADGVSLAQARADLGAATLAVDPDIRPHPVRAEAVAFSAVEIEEPQDAGMRILLAIAQLVPVIVLLIACGNAAILILARTASRWGEVALRTVLGASRARIMGQLFVETLLLALIATGVGLVVIHVTVERLASRFTLPFWFDPGITPAFALKALGLSILCAIVAGVLPAMRATGSTLQRTLQSAGSGGGTLRLGRLAGALIVVEVGVAIIALFAGAMAWRVFQPNPDAYTRVVDADRYLVASIRLPPSPVTAPETTAAPGQDDDAVRARSANLQAELERRLTAQPVARRWTFSDQRPGEEAIERLVRMEGDAADHPGLVGVATFVDAGFFEVLDVPPVAGRLFDAKDVPLNASAEPTAVIVNMKFLERRGMQPQRAIGARFRFLDGRDRRPGPWKEIVGVVQNIEPSADRVFADGTPVVFVPAARGSINPMTVTIDVGKNPAAFAPVLRSLVAEAAPAAFVSEVYALDKLPSEVNPLMIATSATTGIAALAMALATTALYALMSMTVAQRRREFGIRLALGGSAAGVMMTVARRALIQIAIGLTWGAGVWIVLMFSLLRAAPGTEAAKMRAPWAYVLAASAAVVIAIALAAALAPTLRYARMRPVETLRADG
jgi:putative ABC transport system permease protein